MNLPIHKIDPEVAIKELRRNLYIIVGVELVVLFIFGWLSVIPAALSARSLSLTFHPELQGHPGIIKQRVIYLATLCIALAEFGIFIVKR
jgi:hypothetical protein